VCAVPASDPDAHRWHLKKAERKDSCLLGCLAWYESILFERTAFRVAARVVSIHRVLAERSASSLVSPWFELIARPARATQAHALPSTSLVFTSTANFAHNRCMHTHTRARAMQTRM
jgi:hypothetical protein